MIKEQLYYYSRVFALTKCHIAYNAIVWVHHNHPPAPFQRKGEKSAFYVEFCAKAGAKLHRQGMLRNTIFIRWAAKFRMIFPAKKMRGERTRQEHDG